MEQDIIEQALCVLEARMRYAGGDSVTGTDDAKALARLRLGDREHEVFAVMFLDASHRLIEYHELFRGSISSCSVYPREVVKHGLMCNAAAVILIHNHPSGDSRPSSADKQITANLKAALALIDITVLDHLIVGSTVTSMAELGLM